MQCHTKVRHRFIFAAWVCQIVCWFVSPLFFFQITSRGFYSKKYVFEHGVHLFEYAPVHRAVVLCLIAFSRINELLIYYDKAMHLLKFYINITWNVEENVEDWKIFGRFMLNSKCRSSRKTWPQENNTDITSSATVNVTSLAVLYRFIN